MSNSISVEGIVKEIKATEQISAKFSKRSLILTTDDKYPQVLDVQFANDDIVRLDSIAVGMKLKIFVNIRGREWANPQGEVKYFTSLMGWKIENLQQQAPQQQQQPMQQQQQFQQPQQQQFQQPQQQQFQQPQQPSMGQQQQPTEDLPF
jgi:single-stranded DNA-binding protein